MFRRLRTSQKQKQHTQRKTYKQRGGAAWFQIPTSRAGDWGEPLKALGFETIISGDRDADAAANKEKHMEEYFKILEKQDDLFAAAIALIAKKLGLEPTYSATDIARIPNIDDPAKRTEMLEYVTDVEQLVTFTRDIPSADQANLTKLQEIRTARDEPLSTLLLFPKRLNNIFVQSLANILIVLKADQTILQESALNDTMRYNAAVQYDANVRGNAYHQTAHDLRDGFFMNQGKQDFAKDLALVAPVAGRVSLRADASPNFWVTLLQSLESVNTKQESDIFNVGVAPCMLDLKYASWAHITAHIFLAYKLGKLDNVLQFFKTTCSTADPLANDTNRPDIPNKLFDKVPVRGTTFETLLSNMDDSTLQFILHLSYTIRKNEAAVLSAPQLTGKRGSSREDSPAA